MVSGCHVTRLPCGHMFHSDTCIEPWLRVKATCPTCRFHLKTSPAYAVVNTSCSRRTTVARPTSASAQTASGRGQQGIIDAYSGSGGMLQLTLEQDHDGGF
mmetsp:Transcript_3191/g.9078  ORF Transcript_3191/g.9078 Transcript_3191/m.9078 type:complete len:101 (-) Transcript_3191:166-468(-)